MLLQGLCDQTVKVLQIMEAEGIELNVVMLNVLMNAFGIARRHLEALSIYQHIKESVSLVILHQNCWLVMKRLQDFLKDFNFFKQFFCWDTRFLMIFFLFLKGFSPDIVTYTTLMKAFIRAKKFDKVPHTFFGSFTSIFLLM